MTNKSHVINVLSPVKLLCFFFFILKIFYIDEFFYLNMLSDVGENVSITENKIKKELSDDYYVNYKLEKS